MADISIINKDNTNYNMKDAAARLALAEVENKGAKNLFDFSNWANECVVVDGSKTFDGSIFQITASQNSACYTKYESDYPENIDILVTEGEHLEISWSYQRASGSGRGSVYAYCLNGTTVVSTTSAQGTTGRISVIIPSGATTLRLSIQAPANTSEKYSKMMICTTAEWDISHAYVPYGKTNTELTLLEKQDRDGLVTAIDKGAKNVADMSKSSFTANEKDGVTVTLSGDTITSTGTSGTSVNQFHRILYNGDDLLIPPGTWIAALIGTGTGAFRIEVFATGYSDLVKGTYGSTVEFTIPNNATTSYLRITQKPSTNCSGTFKLLITTKAELDISNAFAPFAKTNADITAEADYAVNAGAKNILKVTAKSGSSYGLTREVSDDGTITLTTGQAQNNPTLVGVSSGLVIPKGNWILSGCPSGGGDSTYRIDVRISGTATVLAVDTGGGGALTLSEDTTCSVFIRVAYNYSVSNLVFKPMLRSAAISDTSYQPYARSNPVLTAEMDYVVNAGAKNLLNFDAWKDVGVTRCTKTISGNSITITSTGDDSFTWYIAESTTVQYPVVARIPVEAGKTYRLSWTADNNNKLNHAIYGNGTTGRPDNVVYRGEGSGYLDYTAASDVTFITFRLGLYDSGKTTTFSNVMIRPAAITDPTFQPYARTNRDLTVLTDEDRASLVELVDGGAKNLLKNELRSGTKSGLAYTTGTDGSIVITAGTPTANADFVIPFTPTKTGQYVLQGCPSGGSGTTFKGQITLYPSMTNVVEIFDNTSVIATLTGGTQYAYRFRVYSGKAIGDVTIYPMVCSEAAWKISQSYQPYHSSWQETYLSRGIQISTGDLDDYKSMGRYYIAQASHAADIAHSPTTTAGYTLTVEQGYQVPDGTIQTATVLDTDNSLIVYRRLYRQRSSVWGWSSWYKFEGTAVT